MQLSWQPHRCVTWARSGEQAFGGRQEGHLMLYHYLKYMSQKFTNVSYKNNKPNPVDQKLKHILIKTKCINKSQLKVIIQKMKNMLLFMCLITIHKIKIYHFRRKVSVRGKMVSNHDKNFK